MTERIIIAGAGGQGIMVAGKVLALAAMREGKFITLLPAYGAEVRGGSSHCAVIISEQEINSPYIDQADTLICMNRPSLVKFKKRLKKNGLLIINSSLAAGADIPSRALSAPFSDMAVKLGNIKVANMIALGCFLARKKILSLKVLLRTIAEMAPKKELIQINRQALQEGMKLA